MVGSPHTSNDSSSNLTVRMASTALHSPSMASQKDLILSRLTGGSSFRITW